jgi:catalase-peroxidase
MLILKDNPMGCGFNYREEFKKLDLCALKKDLAAMMRDSQSWWPADYGHYGPFLIRMAWHGVGTYRIMDGKGGINGGAQRFPPLNSWPDNVSLDKARRLLWPVKKKYGRCISWADLMVLAGNVAIESMGGKLIGFAGGREDIWEPDDIFWGPETQQLGDERHTGGQLDSPLAATQMGLIYVNPEGPNGNPDPLASAKDVRVTFARMGMNDEETVALVAGGHTFGKTHGAASPTHVGPPPDAAPIEQQGLGWKNSFGTGHGDDTISSGIEGAWKPHPTTWDMGYLKVLFKYDYELTKSPAGAHMWLAKDVDDEDMVEDAHGSGERHRPMMTTADLGLKVDPIYEPIARDYLENPRKFADSFAKAWFKLTHRDMGPASTYLGCEVPKQTFIWQDPLPESGKSRLNNHDIVELKCRIATSGLTVLHLVSTAWASAATFRASDRRGGANGARIRLQPQISWEVNQPKRLKAVLDIYERIRANFNTRKRCVSLADLIVLGGSVGIETAAQKGGCRIKVPFCPGRTDAFQEQTDIQNMSYLEPMYDGFRNYLKSGVNPGEELADTPVSPEKLLFKKARMLTLTPPEMTVLLGGLRVLGNNYGKSSESKHGVLTECPETLTNDFFVNLLDMATEWKATPDPSLFIGVDRESGEQRWTATRVDLIFGWDAQLRAIAEIYASDDACTKFLCDFVAAWNKVMNADRFDCR